MSCGYNCENNCEECNYPDLVIEYVKGYNQALEDFAKKLKGIAYRIDDSLTLASRDVINEEDIDDIKDTLVK